MTTLDGPTSRGVAELAREVEIQQIRTVELAAKLVAQAPSVAEQIHLDLNANVEASTIDGGFAVEGRFDLKASGPGKNVFVEMSFRVVATYRVARSLPERKVLEGFARTNALIHLWPYFRAFVQQSCGQLTIPPIVVPPFRIKLASSGAEESNEPSGSAGQA